MSVRIEPRRYYGWDGYRLTSNNVAVGIIPDLGGRIVSLELDHEELLFVHKERAGETFDFSTDADFRADKKRIGFGLWGGDKTWVAPQAAWIDAIPPIDLDAGKYELRTEHHSLVLTSPLCRETGLRIVRKIGMNEAGAVFIEHTLINEGLRPIKRGVWDVTQVLRPFDVYVAAPKSALRPYPEEGASEKLYETAVEDLGALSKISCDRPAHFKYGGVSNKGIVLAHRQYRNESIIFARIFAIDAKAAYAHNSNVEVYNSPDYNYLEIETHGAFTELRPAWRSSHYTEWRAYRKTGRLSIVEEFEKLGVSS